jgi:hypothetical protein
MLQLFWFFKSCFIRRNDMCKRSHRNYRHILQKHPPMNIEWMTLHYYRAFDIVGTTNYPRGKLARPIHEGNAWAHGVRVIPLDESTRLGRLVRVQVPWLLMPMVTLSLLLFYFLFFEKNCKLWIIIIIFLRSETNSSMSKASKS